MALINCSECGKEISDKASSCPNCGNPIASQTAAQDDYICCPKCGSKELHADKQGFSGGKALAGAVLTGGIGLLAGTIGSKDIQITCLKCGNQFKAGEARVIRNDNGSFDNEIISVIKSEGNLAATKYYKDKTGEDLAKSKRYVDDLIIRYNIAPKSSNSGCAGMIVAFALILAMVISLCVI